MGINNNAEIIKRLTNLIKSSVPEGVPSQISNVIAPVLDVSPMPEIKMAGNMASDALSANILTTSSTKKTFLVGAIITTSKDVNSTSITSTINVTAKGLSNKNFLKMNYEPATAASNLTHRVILPYPIEVEKGSIITVTNSTAVASIDTSGIIYYYEEEEN